jgi:hypothetical protein
MVGRTGEGGGREERAAIAAASAIGALFAVYLGVMLVVRPPSATEWEHADPILAILPRTLTLGLILVAGFGSAVTWWLVARPSRAAMMSAVRQALAGACVALAVAGGLRLFVGDTLPSFIPAEESAAPGYTLSMAAGYAEEVLFRLGLAALLFFALRRRLGRPAAIALTAVVTGLGFALLHEAGPAASSSAYFTTRFIVPGAAMTVAFLVIGPGFLIGAHCSAHLLIPALFH